MRRVVAAAVLITATIVGASGAVGATAAGAIDARTADSCRLLRAKEITRALGQPAGRSSDVLVPGVCQWNLSATDERGPGIVNTLVERGKRAAQDYAVARSFRAEEREPVDGLGRKAFFAPSTGTVFVLADRSTLFYVQANTYAKDGTRQTTGLRDPLVGLARKARART